MKTAGILVDRSVFGIVPPAIFADQLAKTINHISIEKFKVDICEYEDNPNFLILSFSVNEDK